MYLEPQHPARSCLPGTASVTPVSLPVISTATEEAATVPPARDRCTPLSHPTHVSFGLVTTAVIKADCHWQVQHHTGDSQQLEFSILVVTVKG